MTLPLAPLANLVGSHNQICRTLGVSKSTIHNWAKKGIPSIWKADDAAIRCGWFPTEMWGEEWLRAIA